MSTELLHQHSRILRQLTHNLDMFFFPSTIIDPGHTLQEAGRAAEEKSGNLLVITHFGLGDIFPVLFNLIFGTAGLKDQWAVSPQSWHQYSPFISAMLRELAGHLLPVVNSHTREHPRFLQYSAPEQQRIEADSMRLYLAIGAQVLAAGGTAVIAINAGRQSQLHLTDPQRPIGLFMLKMKQEGITNYGVIPVALGIRGQTNYQLDAVGGLNLRKHYEMTIGGRHQAQSLLQAGVKQIDIQLRTELNKLAPIAYRDTNPDLAR